MGLSLLKLLSFKSAFWQNPTYRPTDCLPFCRVQNENVSRGKRFFLERDGEGSGDSHGGKSGIVVSTDKTNKTNTGQHFMVINWFDAD